MTFERRWVSPLTKVRIEDGCFQASELLAKRKTKKSSAHVGFLSKLRHGEVMKRFVRFTYRRRDKSLRNVNLRTEKTLWQHQHTVCSLDKQRRGASGVDSMFQNIFFPDSVLCDDFCVGDRKSLTFQERWYWKWNWASVKRLASLQRLLTRTKLPCVQTQYSSIRKQEREREKRKEKKAVGEKWTRRGIFSSCHSGHLMNCLECVSAESFRYASVLQSVYSVGVIW